MPGVESVAAVEQDFREELDTCLEVLAEFVEGETILTPGNIEFVTACAQTVELVQLLLDENEAAWSAIEALRAAIASLQERVRHLESEQRLWTPGQGGSSGQRRSPQRALRS